MPSKGTDNWPSILAELGPDGGNQCPTDAEESQTENQRSENAESLDKEGRQQDSKPVHRPKANAASISNFPIIQKLVGSSGGEVTCLKP